MAAVQMDFMRRNQTLMNHFNEMYDNRIRMLLQQKRNLSLAIQHSMDLQMQCLMDGVLSMEQGTEIPINQKV